MTISSTPIYATQNDWLIDGGEMGELIRSMDWSQTPLGTRHLWPQSLRVAIGLCLESPLPSAIAWGTQRTHIYNDRYIPFCAKSHPQSMGRDFKECWYFAWPTINDALTRAQTGKATRLEEQCVFLEYSGHLEENFFALSFSPIRDESGGIGGVFIQLAELTQHKLAERRSNLLLALSAEIAEAAPERTIAAACDALTRHDQDLPFFLIYLIDVDARQGRLVCSGGLPAGTVASPDLIELDKQDERTWPLVRAFRSRRGEYIDNLENRFGPVVCQPYPEPVRTAVLLPLTRSGIEHPLGVLIAGMSPRLPLDNGYRTFHELLRDRLASVLPLSDNCIAQAAIARTPFSATVHGTRTEPEERIRRLVESNFVGVFSFFGYLDDGMNDANDEMLRIVGYTRDDLLCGKVNWKEMTPPEFREATAYAADELRKTGTCIPYQKEYIRKDGSRVPVIVWSALVEGAPGTEVAFVLDLSERERTREALRKSEEQWRDVFENNPTMYFIIDASGTVISVNSIGAEQLGYTVDELVGRSVLQVFSKTEQPEASRQVTLCLQHPGQTMSWEIRKIRKDGSMLWVRETAKAVVREKNQLIVLIVCEDITTRRQAEDALRHAHEMLEKRVQERTAELMESNQRLELEIVERTRAETVLARRSQELARSNAELEQFAYIASHDLREPLRMVTSYLQLIEKRYKDRLDADGHEFIGYAVNGARRMQTLIDDLLRYSRIGIKAKPMQPVDCTTVVETVMQSLRLTITETNTRITCSNLPTVLGDEVQLAQLFQNLIANAIKFRRDAPPEINIRAEQEKGFWSISVQDNGIGIDAEYFGRIFEMFQRLHGYDTYSGNGIGLTICRKIVEHHGGRIWVESATGKGSIFIFTLPHKAEDT